jgi:hypothetical protein
MGTVKIKTNSKVKMRAPINTVEELDKVIKFLAAERDALLKAEGKQPKKKVAEAIKADLNTGFEAARARA